MTKFLASRWACKEPYRVGTWKLAGEKITNQSNCSYLWMTRWWSDEKTRDRDRCRVKKNNDKNEHTLKHRAQPHFTDK